MAPLRGWLPTHRWELRLVALCFIGLLALALYPRGESAATTILIVAVEVGLPIALGVIAAGLMANDPALDLLLSVAQPASRTLLQRLLVVLGHGLVLALLMLLGARWGGVAFPIVGALTLLVWATPALLFAGVATVGALLRGRMLDGVALVLSVGGMALLLTLGSQSDCPPDVERACRAALATPFMTLFRPHDPLWLMNRLLWMSVAGALLAVGFWLVGQEERLLMGARPGEQGE